MLFSQARKLQRQAANLHVKLEIDHRLHNIKIVGVSKDAYAMSDVIAIELQQMGKDANERMQETLMAQVVQWKYEDDNLQLVDYSPLINKVLLSPVTCCGTTV